MGPRAGHALEHVDHAGHAVALDLGAHGCDEGVVAGHRDSVTEPVVLLDLCWQQRLNLGPGRALKLVNVGPAGATVPVVGADDELVTLNGDALHEPEMVVDCTV